MALYEPKADEARIADVLDELRTLPFLAPRRVVLIKDAEPFVKENVSYLENYLDDPSPSGVLILTATAWDKRRSLHKKLQKSGTLMELEKMKSSQMPAYVTSYAHQTCGIRLDHQCSRSLVELVGDDPGRLCREMDKLAIFVAPKKTVTPQDIEQLIGKNRMFGAFEVIDAINAGQIAPALSRLRNMFEADKNADYTVVGAFGWHFRRLFRAKAYMQKGLSPQEAAKNAGVYGYFQPDFLRQAAQMTLPQLGAILAELGQIDFGIKTGQTTAPTALERLITNVFLMQKSR
jgi:DNA polymerase-3 subunit delta